jgi:hypothetical protein
MIIAKSLNTPIATFTTLQDLARNFNPSKVQDYTYIDTVKNEYVSWLKVSDEKRLHAPN